MKKILSILTLITLIGYGASPFKAYSAPDKDVITVHVNGMVCDFCARALEKTFLRQESVKDITVDLSAKVVKVYLKTGQDLHDDDGAAESERDGNIGGFNEGEFED